MTNREDRKAMELVEHAAAALRDAPVPPGPPKEIVVSTVETLRTLDTPAEVVRRNARRKLMLRITGYSGVAAASSVLVVGVCLLCNGSGSGIALADVQKQIMEAKSFSYEVVNEPLGNNRNPGWEKKIMKVTFKEPGLYREDRWNGIVVISSSAAGKVLLCDSSTKTATLNPCNPRLADKIPFREFFLGEHRAWRDGAEQRLGEREVDGTKAQGFAVRENDTTVWNFWVNAKTGKPVRVERLCPLFKTIMSKIVTNPELPDSLFSVEPPKGYQVERHDTK